MSQGNSLTVPLNSADCEKFKLGYGVDLTDPSHKRSSRPVRSVCNDVSNILENADHTGCNEFEEEISSTKSYSAYIKGNASAPCGIGFSAEARAYRNNVKVMISKGKEPCIVLCKFNYSQKHPLQQPQL